MILCVAIPALNEAATIADVLAKIPNPIQGISEVLAVVIDDGSTDDTKALAEEAGAIVVSHPRNLGVGAAFQTAVNKALSLNVHFWHSCTKRARILSPRWDKYRYQLQLDISKSPPMPKKTFVSTHECLKRTEKDKSRS